MLRVYVKIVRSNERLIWMLWDVIIFLRRAVTLLLQGTWEP